jgi:hypothetical protein
MQCKNKNLLMFYITKFNFFPFFNWYKKLDFYDSTQIINFGNNGRERDFKNANFSCLLYNN